MNNFQSWLNEADMPTQDNTGWFDAETGFRYNPSINYAAANKSARKSLSIKAQDARQLAKLFGGKALTGSKAQKEWAEQIRAEKLGDMSEDQAEMACDASGLGRSAHFWIEARGRTGCEIGDFFMLQKALLRRALSLRSAGKSDEYVATAAEYNALTTAWGFTK